MISENEQFLGSSLEFQVLREDFVQICQGNGLDSEGMRIVDEIYKGWLVNIENTEVKMQIAEEKMREYDNSMAVILSLRAISLAYIEEGPDSPLGKFARKARNN